LSPNATGSYGLPRQYNLNTQFSGLGLKAYDKLPGFSNLSGSIDVNETRGTLRLATRKAELDFNQVFRMPIPADSLDGQVNWSHNKNGMEFRFNRLAIANEHLAGTVNGRFVSNGTKGGYIDIQAPLPRAHARLDPKYYPLILSKNLLDWLDKAIVAGQGEDIKVVLKGNLKDFPYPQDRQGLFKVTAKVSNGVLEFAEGWPRIDGIKLDMLFQGRRMQLDATAGN